MYVRGDKPYIWIVLLVTIAVGCFTMVFHVVLGAVAPWILRLTVVFQIIFAVLNLVHYLRETVDGGRQFRLDTGEPWVYLGVSILVTSVLAAALMAF